MITKDQKRDIKKYRFTAKEVAGIVGCSASYVKHIRGKSDQANTLKALKVKKIEEFLTNGSHKLIKSAKHYSNFEIIEYD